MKPSSELLADAFQRARQHWKRGSAGELQMPRPPKPVEPLTVAVSRERGALGSEISRQVGRRLGWPVYDRELISKIAEDSGLREELLASVDEKETSWLADCLGAFSGSQHVSAATYAHQLARVLAAISAHGHCVIVGRGAVALLPERTTLRVWIVAPLPERVSRIEEDMRLSKKVAKQHVQSTDRERGDFVKKHFLKDVRDTHLYDLVLNSSRLGVDNCVDLITRSVELKEGPQAQLQGGHVAQQCAGE